MQSEYVKMSEEKMNYLIDEQQYYKKFMVHHKGRWINFLIKKNNKNCYWK